MNSKNEQLDNKKIIFKNIQKSSEALKQKRKSLLDNSKLTTPQVDKSYILLTPKCILKENSNLTEQLFIDSILKRPFYENYDNTAYEKQKSRKTLNFQIKQNDLSLSKSISNFNDYESTGLINGKFFNKKKALIISDSEETDKIENRVDNNLISNPNHLEFNSNLNTINPKENLKLAYKVEFQEKSNIFEVKSKVPNFSESKKIYNEPKNQVKNIYSYNINKKNYNNNFILKSDDITTSILNEHEKQTINKDFSFSNKISNDRFKKQDDNGKKIFENKNTLKNNNKITINSNLNEESFNKSEEKEIFKLIPNSNNNKNFYVQEKLCKFKENLNDFKTNNYISVSHSKSDVDKRMNLNTQEKIYQFQSLNKKTNFLLNSNSQKSTDNISSKKKFEKRYDSETIQEAIKYSQECFRNRCELISLSEFNKDRKFTMNSKSKNTDI